MSKLSWDYITKEAATSKGMNRKDCIAFHRFNDNGITGRYIILRNKLFEAVDAKKCKSGALLAYNFDFHYKALEKLYKLAEPSWAQIRVALEMAEWEYNSLKEYLDKLSLEN